MKKFKKIAALLLAMVMALAMAVPAMAEDETEAETEAEKNYTTTTSPYETTITVNGLSAQEVTTVKIYKVVTYDSATQSWVVEDWAKNYVTLTSNPVVVSWDSLKSVVEAEGSTVSATYTLTAAKGETSVSQVVPVGAYLILASGDEATYNVMGAETYKQDETYLTAEDVTVNAKTSGYNVDKTADDKFVAKGQTVTFTITTVFPTFEFSDTKTSGTYSIVDTPTGLDITKNSIVVKVGGSDVTSTLTIEKDPTTGKVTITWPTITNNNDAGKTVEVTVPAVVTSDTGYTQAANAVRDGSNLDDNPPTVNGYTGDITLTKYATDETTVLSGAEFEVYKGESTTPLSFVKVSDGVYKLAGGDTEGTETTTTIVATNGTVKVSGLDEGTYSFKETKAPAGYSINTTNTEVTITANESKNVSMTGSMTDTKLSALPSTGGIGTTIFTVAGCMIMIAAGGMLIVSRRRKNA